MPKTTEQSRIEGVAADPCCFWQKLFSNIYIILIDFNACDFHTALVMIIASTCRHITEYADTSAEIDEFDVVFVIERDMQPKVTGQSVWCKKGSCCTIDTDAIPRKTLYSLIEIVIKEERANATNC